MKAIPKNELIDAVFQHVRDLTTAVTIMAAGLIASRHDLGSDLAVPALLGGRTLGYVVAAIGLALVVLNLFDGVKKLAALRPQARPLVWTGIVALNTLVTLRVVEVLVMIRIK